MVCSFLQDDGDSEPTLNGDDIDRFGGISADTGLGGDPQDQLEEDLHMTDLLPPDLLPVANGTPDCEGEGGEMWGGTCWLLSLMG